MKKHLATWLMACAAASAQAAPMGFKDSVMTMGDFGPGWRELNVNYALTARDAVGGGVLSMRSDDRRRERDLVEANVTRLLARWNLPDAQANVWLFGGIGTLKGNDFTGERPMVTPGAQVDYETTRIYLAAVARLYRAAGIHHDYVALRAGFSFYEVDYDETQPWFVLEARRMRDLSDRVEVTPMLRFIHNRYFFELGYSNNREARFNVMYVF